MKHQDQACSDQECSTEYEQQCASVPQETCTTVYETVCETTGHKTDNLVDKVGVLFFCLTASFPDHETAQPRDRCCHRCGIWFAQCWRPVRLNHNLVRRLRFNLDIVRIWFNFYLLWSCIFICWNSVHLIRLRRNFSKRCGSGCRWGGECWTIWPVRICWVPAT